jgi:hypothetical protein
VGKIFCIGLNKTGTLSLHHALETLGYWSLHWGGPNVVQGVRRAKEEGMPLLSYMDHDYDAFSDILSLSVNFDLADEQYPGSRFILTVRPLAQWLDSRRRHVEKNRVRKELGEYGGGFLDVDTEGWTAEFVEHRHRIETYFAHRPDDLLIMDVTSGDGWDELCPFLGVERPAVPFPWQNRYAPR